MKVAFATYDAPRDVGGVSTWLQRLLPLLQAAGIEVEVHLMAIDGKSGSNCEFFKEHGISFRWIPWQENLRQGVRAFLKFLEESQPDVYVPNCMLPAYFAAAYAKKAGIPTVGVLHSHDDFYWGLVDEFINGSPRFRVTAIVPISRFLESELISAAAMRGVTIRQIDLGVPIPPRETQAPKSVFRLVYIGRLTERAKRVSDVATALCAVARGDPSLQAWIVGDGDARDSVEAIIRKENMGAQVQLLGRIDNKEIYDVLAQCHALVLLSDYEGLPISMLEAMAAGVVPICLDTRSGIREALEDGKNGLIVKDRAEDFFNAVKKLQIDSAMWQRLSLAARETIRQRYSVEACARQWAGLLEGLDKARSTKKKFKAPQLLRLPPPNPKFGYHDTRQSWRRILRNYIRSNPVMHRMAKAVVVRFKKNGRSQI